MDDESNVLRPEDGSHSAVALAVVTNAQPSCATSAYYGDALDDPLVAALDQRDTEGTGDGLRYTAEGIFRQWLASKSKLTRKAYEADLRDFADFLRRRGALGARPSPLDAVRILLSSRPPVVTGAVMSYVADLRARQKHPRTTNRKLSTLRSIVALAQALGTVSWSLHVDSLRGDEGRDMKGPQFPLVRRLVALAARQGGSKGARDVALIHLLYSRALRRSEVCSLDVESFDSLAGTLNVLQKGKTVRQTIPIPSQATSAILSYLALSGSPTTGPLFRNEVRNPKLHGKRLASGGLYRVVRALGRRARNEGIPLRPILSPQRLRHGGITLALNETGSVREVQKFSRHASVTNVMIYDDEEEAERRGVEIAETVGAKIGLPRLDGSRGPILRPIPAGSAGASETPATSDKGLRGPVPEDRRA